MKNTHFLSKQKCLDYVEKWPFMGIFQYNLYISVFDTNRNL